MISPPPESCDKLNISWTAPANNRGLPIKYTLYLNEYRTHSLMSYNKKDIFFIMNNLTANTEYTVTIEAFNRAGEGGNETETGITRPEGLSNIL